jgi:hypothetical protein
MAGPTTGILNEEFKDVRNDLKILTESVHQLGTKIEVVCGQLSLLANLAKVAIGLVGGLLTTELVTGIWWASGISSEVKHLENAVAEIRKSVDPSKKVSIAPVLPLK